MFRANSRTSLQKNLRLSFLLLNLFFTLPVWAQAPPSGAPSTAVPHLVRYSGVLKNTDGKPRDGVAGITFALYKDEQGGVPLWVETQNVQADAQGHYSVYLGASNIDGIPQELFVSGEARWLGVQVEGQAEQPRTLLLSVPYALKASDAETIGGLPPSAFVLANPSGGTASGGSTSSNTSSSELAAPPLNPPVTGLGTVKFLPLWDSTSDIVSSVLFQSGSGATAKVGIGITTPGSTLDVKGTGTFRGVLNLPATGTANASAGRNSQPIKLAASAFNSGTNTAVNQNFLWQAEPVNNNTNNASGSLNLLFSLGSGQPAETGLKISNTGVFTFASGQAFPGTGTITGVTAGSGLGGGGNSGSVTLNVDTTKVVTGVTAGTDLTGGGTGGVQTLNLDTTKVPQLNVANIFTGNQTVNGNLSATGLVSGSAFNIGSNLFASGSYAGSNAFLGFSGNTTATGTFNAASGFGALSLNTAGAYNTASGAYALQHNTTGNGNTASGNGAMQVNTTGSNNTASGATALANNTNGIYNTADGVAALFANTAGTYNTASGSGALGSNTTGYNNTGSGDNALFNNTTGHDNSAFGYLAGPPAGHPDLTNATAIGAYAEVDTSNSLVLGSIKGANGALDDTNVGIGVTAPAYRLHVGSGNNTFRVDGPPQGTVNPLMASFGGTGDFAIDAVDFGAGRFVVKDNGHVGIGVANPSNLLTLRPFAGHAISDGWDVYSSRRWKTNIQTLNRALEKVEQLRGVSYDRKETGKHEIGVIAEEVGQVVPEIVTYEADGKDARGVDYSRLTALLIEAVKQQQRQIHDLKSELRKTRQSLQGSPHKSRPLDPLSWPASEQRENGLPVSSHSLLMRGPQEKNDSKSLRGGNYVQHAHKLPAPARCRDRFEFRCACGSHIAAFCPGAAER